MQLLHGLEFTLSLEKNIYTYGKIDDLHQNR